MGECASLGTELQGGHSVAVPGDIDVGRIRVQTLAEHQYRLAMFIAAGAEEADIGGEHGIARNLFPDKLEGIRAQPHVLATTRDGVCLLGRVKFHGAGMKHRADISVAFEYADGSVALSKGVIRCDTHQQTSACHQCYQRNIFSLQGKMPPTNRNIGKVERQLRIVN